MRRITIKAHKRHWSMAYHFDTPGKNTLTDSEALKYLLCMVDPGPEYVVVFTEGYALEPMVIEET